MPQAGGSGGSGRVTFIGVNFLNSKRDDYTLRVHRVHIYIDLTLGSVIITACDMHYCRDITKYIYKSIDMLSAKYNVFTNL